MEFWSWDLWYANQHSQCHLASRRLQFAVRWTVCRFGGFQVGSSSCASRNAFWTRAQIRFTSPRFSCFKPFNVDGSGQPCSVKSTKSVNNFSFGNRWMKLTPRANADSTQHGRRPQVMIKFSKLAYAASSAWLISSGPRISHETSLERQGTHLQPRYIHMDSARQFRYTPSSFRP